MSISLGEYARTRDPFNADNLFDLALAYRGAGKLDQAMETLRTILSVSPNYLEVHLYLGGILLQKGDSPAALREIRMEGEGLPRESSEAMVLGALGRKAEADATLAKLMATGDAQSAARVASVLAYRGDADGAFEWLEKSLQRPGADLRGMGLSPEMAKLRMDPRWLPLLRRIGDAPEQLAKVQFNLAAPH